jgi:hypothetical protein
VKSLEKLKHEFRLVLPPTLFFLFAFLLLAITQRLIQREYGLPLSGFGGVVIGALLVGKIVLITDKLSLMNKFPDKPLFYNILWKSGVYFLAAFLARYIEHVFPLFREHGSFMEAHRHLLAEVIWPHFWLIQMWVGVLFFLYCTLRELVIAVGREKVIRLFLRGMSDRE